MLFRSASILLAAASGRPGIAELLITLFVFVTAPVSANLLSQAALHLRLPSRAPEPANLSPSHPATDAANSPPKATDAAIRTD